MKDKLFDLAAGTLHPGSIFLVLVAVIATIGAITTGATEDEDSPLLTAYALPAFTEIRQECLKGGSNDGLPTLPDDIAGLFTRHKIEAGKPLDVEGLLPQQLSLFSAPVLLTLEGAEAGTNSAGAVVELVGIYRTEATAVSDAALLLEIQDDGTIVVVAEREDVYNILSFLGPSHQIIVVGTSATPRAQATPALTPDACSPA